jgi:hypothetical protein
MSRPSDHLLLIEDNPSDAKLVQRALTNTRFGPFQLEWVENLSDGLERLSKGGIDAVLADLSLPDSRGIETLASSKPLRTKIGTRGAASKRRESLRRPYSTERKIISQRITSTATHCRGFGSQFSKSVLVLIDGRSVYTPLDSGVNWQFQDTLLEDIERIEIIRGPGGTKSAKDTHGALATIGGGNVDQGTGGARFGGTNGRGFDYRVYSKGFLRGPEFHPDGSNFDYWKTGQVGFRTDWEVTARDTLTLQGNMYKGLDGERVAVSTLPAQTVTAYGSADVRFGWRPTSNWDLSVAGQNLLQPRHAEFGGDASTMVGIKRSAYAKITWRR